MPGSEFVEGDFSALASALLLEFDARWEDADRGHS
jgi:hypothetical protein